MSHNKVLNRRHGVFCFLLIAGYASHALAVYCPKAETFYVEAATGFWASNTSPGWKSKFLANEYPSKRLDTFRMAVAYGPDKYAPGLIACVYRLINGDVVAMEPNSDKLYVNRNNKASGTWQETFDYGSNYRVYICRGMRTDCQFNQ